MPKPKLRERQFKRLAFATTLAGVIVMAVGLQQGVSEGRWLVAVLLFAIGGIVALASAFVELVPEAGFTITLYTRDGCSLCDAARDFLVGKKGEYDYDLWEIDVDKDPALQARYGDWVPVAAVKNEELFRLAPDYPRLEAKLRQLADARVKR